MTIGTNNRVDNVGNGAVDTYSFTFKVFAATDLRVTVRDTDGVETELAYPTHYTVSGVGAAAGGSVALVNGAFDWLDVDGDLESDYALTIRRVVTISQTTDIRNQSQVFNDVLEDTFDKLAMIDQQQQDELNRSLKFPETDGVSLSTILPTASERANKTLAFDDDGNPTATATPVDVQAAVDLALAYRDEAEDWAHKTDDTVDGVEYSAKYNAELAAISALAADASEAAVAAMVTSAATAAKFYDTIALGLAGTAASSTFGVLAGGSDGLTRPTLYRDDGTATRITGLVPDTEYDALFPTILGVNPVWGVNDDRGNTAIEVGSTGRTTVADLIALQTNGLDLRYSGRPASLGNFDAELMVFIGEGQSNMQGRQPGITTTVEYDNIGFAAQANAPVAYSDLTVANSGFDGVQESMIFGALGYIKKLLLQENGLSQTDIAYQLLAGDNSQGSTAISAHVKGSQYYGYGTSQATAAVTLAAAASRSVMHGGVFWNQGEADSATALATYQAALQLLATNYNTDLKAITGQTKDITLITAQTTSNTANRNVALAQLAASAASSLVKVCCPMYHFDYESDGIHVINRHDYWVGAYYGLVWKRLWVDLLTWKPTQPLSSTRSGKIAYVTFDCMVQPLVLDTTNVPAQTNYGFTMVDSGGSALTISSVTVVAPNKLKIVTSTNMGANAKLRYGFGAATGKGGYTGAAGNLRDSQGNCVPTADAAGSFLMHNWCVAHEFTIA